MSIADITPGIGMFFRVSIDAFELGYWTKMSGLGIEIKTTPRSDSAMSFFQHHMPAHMEYSHITLERPLTTETGLVLAWFNTYHMLPIPTAGSIQCLDQSLSVIMSWDMIGVSPVRWKGPSMDASASNNVATEVLELAHMGFL